MTQPFQQPVNPFQKEEVEKKAFVNDLNNKLREQIIHVFCNPHGIQLLDTLEEIFLKQPVCPPGCVEGYGFKRDGENQLIIRIANIARQAMNPTPSE
jgi:hypothetical protein